MKRAMTFEQATEKYKNRFTMDFVPSWANEINTGNGKYYAPQYISDREWYDKTKFKGEPGFYGTKNECQSEGATFPLGHWLNEPYVKRYVFSNTN